MRIFYSVWIQRTLPHSIGCCVGSCAMMNWKKNNMGNENSSEKFHTNFRTCRCSSNEIAHRKNCGALVLVWKDGTMHVHQLPTDSSCRWSVRHAERNSLDIRERFNWPFASRAHLLSRSIDSVSIIHLHEIASRRLWLRASPIHVRCRNFQYCLNRFGIH